MKIKIKVQVGAFHKSKEHPDGDFLYLIRDPNEIIEDVLAKEHQFKVKNVHRLADGSIHLIEFEAETYEEL